MPNCLFWEIRSLLRQTLCAEKDSADRCILTLFLQEIMYWSRLYVTLQLLNQLSQLNWDNQQVRERVKLGRDKKNNHANIILTLWHDESHMVQIFFAIW